MFGTTMPGPDPTPLSQQHPFSYSRSTMAQAQQHFRTCFNFFLQMNRVSLKLIFHILLLTAAMSQLLIDSSEADYLRSAKRTWLHFFFPREYTLNPEGSPMSLHYLYTSDEVISTLRHALEGYEKIVQVSLDTLIYSPPGEGSPTIPTPANLVITKYTSPFVFDPNKNYDSRSETETYQVNSTNLAVLESEVARLEILRRLVKMELSLQLVTIELVTFRRSCLVWDVRLVFDFSARGQIALKLNDMIQRDCDDTTSSSDLLEFTHFLWINVVILILSVAYLTSLIRTRMTLVDFGYTYQLGQKLTKLVLNFWFLSDLICLFCLCFSSLLNIYSNSARRPTTIFHSFLVGLGNCLLWINLVQYFSNYKNYFALILTLEKSVPKVMKFLLGVLPIFMGYAVFGVAFFGAATIRFSSIRDSFVALFSLLNGDAVHETFLDLLPYHSVITMFYVYSFILLWTYVVLNILIAIVEESFFISLWVDNKQQQQQPSRESETEEPIDEDLYHRGRNAQDSTHPSVPPPPGQWFRNSRIGVYQQQQQQQQRQESTPSASSSEISSNTPISNSSPRGHQQEFWFQNQTSIQ